MPNSNIERAISAGAGGAHSDQAKEVVYEGFGPAGVAIVVEAVTDNPNRTAADMRSIFSRHGGSLGSLNSVTWMFTARGAIRVPAASLPADRDNFTLAAVDAGAEDIIEDDEEIIFYTSISSLPNFKSWLEQRGLQPSSTGPELVATNKVTVSDSDQVQLYALLEDLDEHLDVTNFFTNEN
jgi:YebC/PmpR family DNA-binding regulatory protein